MIGINLKYFIITVDTEGDNLWEYVKGNSITTNNSCYLPRFQELCNRYNFKPVWLTNYEMVSDDRFVDFAQEQQTQGNCEVGIHVHAWNNPPIYHLNGKYKGNPYLIEYPKDVMREKFATIYNLIKNRFGKAPVTHRAGRWIMNDDYFRILEDFDIRIDCSYTPGISWMGFEGESVKDGCDYSKVSKTAHLVGNVLEVPVTIRQAHLRKGGRMLGRFKSLILGTPIWFRPAMSSLEDMMRLMDKVDAESDCDYLEFMIHSSELMPGGSPYFKTSEDIERLYEKMAILFDKAIEMGYVGATLADYYNSFIARQ